VIHATPAEVVALDHPFVQDFFCGGRGRRAQALLQPPPQAV
jgi:phospholipid/cholesterol/gamma-HCH transport system ATP-binding protein